MLLSTKCDQHRCEQYTSFILNCATPPTFSDYVKYTWTFIRDSSGVIIHQPN